jgi:nicotinamidase/pyrazinamidase
VLFSAIDGREAGFEVNLAAAACRGIDVDGSLARAMRSMIEAGVALLAE